MPAAPASGAVLGGVTFAPLHTGIQAVWQLRRITRALHDSTFGTFTALRAFPPCCGPLPVSRSGKAGGPEVTSSRTSAPCGAIQRRVRRRTLSPHRAQAGPSGSIGSIVIRPVATALGPFTAEAASNLPSGTDAHRRRRAGPPDHVSTLSGPGICPYPASCPGRPAEGQPCCPGFLPPFGHRHSLPVH